MEAGQPRALELDRIAGRPVDQLEHPDVDALVHLGLEVAAVEREDQPRGMAAPWPRSVSNP